MAKQKWSKENKVNRNENLEKSRDLPMDSEHRLSRSNYRNLLLTLESYEADG